MTTTRTELSSEWTVLQQHYYRYEQQALLIKLLAIALTALGLVFAAALGVLAVVAILWLQEAILRTWQARLGERSLKLEAALRTAADDVPAWQLHSDWTTTRPSTTALLQAYLGNALRPTVAFPYALLLVMGGLSLVLR